MFTHREMNEAPGCFLILAILLVIFIVAGILSENSKKSLPIIFKVPDGTTLKKKVK